VNPHADEIESFSLTLCIARHLARVYGENEARAITRCARKVRDQTKHPRLYQLAKMYSGELATRTVGDKRMTGDDMKVMSVTALEAGMREKGILKMYEAAA
jgi:hypothetical protein